MINNIHYEEALNNILIVVLAGFRIFFSPVM